MVAPTCWVRSNLFLRSIFSPLAFDDNFLFAVALSFSQPPVACRCTRCYCYCCPRSRCWTHRRCRSKGRRSASLQESTSTSRASRRDFSVMILLQNVFPRVWELDWHVAQHMADGNHESHNISTLKKPTDHFDATPPLVAAQPIDEAKPRAKAIIRSKIIINNSVDSVELVKTCRTCWMCNIVEPAELVKLVELV